mgnify:CR=1 FL=1
MTEIVIRWEKLPEEVKIPFYFELRDMKTLLGLEQTLKLYYPGNWRATQYVDANRSNDFIVETDSNMFEIMKLSELS